MLHPNNLTIFFRRHKLMGHILKFLLVKRLYRTIREFRVSQLVRKILRLTFESQGDLMNLFEKFHSELENASNTGLPTNSSSNVF